MKKIKALSYLLLITSIFYSCLKTLDEESLENNIFFGIENFDSLDAATQTLIRQLSLLPTSSLLSGHTISGGQVIKPYGEGKTIGNINSAESFELALHIVTKDGEFDELNPIFEEEWKVGESGNSIYINFDPLWDNDPSQQITHVYAIRIKPLGTGDYELLDVLVRSSYSLNLEPKTGNEFNYLPYKDSIYNVTKKYGSFPDILDPLDVTYVRVRDYDIPLPNGIIDYKKIERGDWRIDRISGLYYYESLNIKENSGVENRKLVFEFTTDYFNGKWYEFGRATQGVKPAFEPVEVNEWFVIEDNVSFNSWEEDIYFFASIQEDSVKIRMQGYERSSTGQPIFNSAPTYIHEKFIYKDDTSQPNPPYQPSFAYNAYTSFTKEASGTKNGWATNYEDNISQMNNNYMKWVFEYYNGIEWVLLQEVYQKNNYLILSTIGGRPISITHEGGEWPISYNGHWKNNQSVKVVAYEYEYDIYNEEVREIREVSSRYTLTSGTSESLIIEIYPFSQTGERYITLKFTVDADTNETWYSWMETMGEMTKEWTQPYAIRQTGYPTP